MEVHTTSGETFTHFISLLPRTINLTTTTGGTIAYDGHTITEPYDDVLIIKDKSKPIILKDVSSSGELLMSFAGTASAITILTNLNIDGSVNDYAEISPSKTLYRTKPLSFVPASGHIAYNVFICNGELDTPITYDVTDKILIASVKNGWRSIRRCSPNDVILNSDSDLRWIVKVPFDSDGTMITNLSWLEQDLSYYELVPLSIKDTYGFKNVVIQQSSSTETLNLSLIP